MNNHSSESRPLTPQETKAHFLDIEEWLKAGSRLRAPHDRQGWRTGTEQAVVIWLLGFLTEDLSTLSLGQRSDRTWEVFRFSFDCGLHEGSHTSMTRQPSELEWPSIVALQADTSQALAQFLETDAVDFPEGVGAFRISRRALAQRTPYFSSHSLKAAFFYHTARLLAKYGDRLRACKGCNALMLVKRANKFFCSQGCQIKTFIRAKRADAKKRLTATRGRAKHATKR